MHAQTLYSNYIGQYCQMVDSQNKVQDDGFAVGRMIHYLDVTTIVKYKAIYLINKEYEIKKKNVQYETKQRQKYKVTFLPPEFNNCVFICSKS